MRISKSRYAAIAASVALALGAAGCTTSDPQPVGDYSRVAFYDSVDAMAKDSDAIVVGKVVKQEVTDDIQDDFFFTLSHVEVQDADEASGLKPGDVVIVRQVGGESTPALTKMLDTEHTYLLYLTASGLDGDLASQYYPTGVVAGVYVASSDTASKNVADMQFTQLEPDPGDTLPKELDTAEAIG